MNELTMDGATKKLRKWKTLYFLSLILPAAAYLVYAFYALSYTPTTQTILLNQLGGVYSNEDLGKTNVTEGQLKQFAHKMLKTSFSFDYLSLVSESDYKNLLSGNKDSDLPDHRDKVSPYFSKTAHAELLDKLIVAPWMTGFYVQQKQISIKVSSPPAQEGGYGWVKGKDGKLTQTYNGHAFIYEQTNKRKNRSYKIIYTLVLERKPLFLDNKDGVYYYPPMVPPNLFEWRVRRFDWKLERRA